MESSFKNKMCCNDRISSPYLMMVVVNALLIAFPTLAEEVGNQGNSDADITLTEKVVNYSEQSHKSLSSVVSGLGRGIDNYFADGHISAEPNNSYVSVEYRNSYSHLNFFDGKVKVRGRLDLPRSKQRFNLFLDTDPDDDESLSNRVIQSRGSESENDSVFGFGYLKSNHIYNVSHGLGLSSGDPLDVFYRLRVDGDSPITDNWQQYLKQEGWYYHQRSWGLRSQASFTYDLSDRWQLSSTSQGQYEHRYRNSEAAQIFSAQHYLSDRQNVQYNVGLLATNKPDWMLTDYFISVDYRRKLYKNWLYMSLIPELLWVEEDRAHVLPEDQRKRGFDPWLTLKLEVIFSETPSYRYRHTYNKPSREPLNKGEALQK